MPVVDHHYEHEPFVAPSFEGTPGHAEHVARLEAEGIMPPNSHIALANALMFQSFVTEIDTIVEDRLPSVVARMQDPFDDSFGGNIVDARRMARFNVIEELELLDAAKKVAIDA